MAISPSRISSATQHKHLQETGVASSRCIEALDKMFTHPLCHRVDPERVSTFYIADSFHPIRIQNSEYMKDLLVRQIVDAYKEAGWKNAYVGIEYREEEFADKRQEPLTLTVHSLRVDLFFMQDSDYVTDDAQAQQGKPKDQWAPNGSFRVITDDPVSVQLQYESGDGTGNSEWRCIDCAEAIKLAAEITRVAESGLLPDRETPPVDGAGVGTDGLTFRMPEDMVMTNFVINGSSLKLAAGQTLTVRIEEQEADEPDTVQPSGFIPVGTPTGEYRIISDNGGTLQRSFSDGFGGEYWHSLNYVQAQEFIAEVMKLTVNSALRIFAPNGVSV